MATIPELMGKQMGTSWESMKSQSWEFLAGKINGLPSAYLLHSHGIDGPFIHGLPMKNGDFPWLC